MRITHHGHACVVIDDPAAPTGTILVDPGSLAGDLDGVGPVDAIFVTHEHIDHIEAGRLAALRARNPELDLYAGPGTRTVLPPQEQERVTVLEGDGVASDVAGWQVVTTSVTHASIYSAIPDVSNNTYLLADRVYHPGDAFVPPALHVDVLLLPIGAPWLKLSEAIDYLRLVAPRIAIPIHQGGLAPAHQALHGQLLRKFAPKGTELVVPEVGTPVTV